MSQKLPLICLYHNNVPDIKKAIETGRKSSYNRIVTRLKSPQLAHRINAIKDESKNDVLTRSDLLLSIEEWRQTILKVSEIGDCDSHNKGVRNAAIRMFKEEITWSKHLDSIACIIVTLNNDESFNMARQLLEKFDRAGCVLTEIPIIDTSYFTQKYSQNQGGVNMVELKSSATAVVWKRWNRFRLSTEFSGHIKVALQLTAVLPNDFEIRRWFGEPVEMIIIPAMAFERLNNNDQISLKECYSQVCQEFWIRTGANFAVRCTVEDPYIDAYPKCLRNILSKYCKEMPHQCNKLDRSGLKLPFTTADTLNNCTKYQERLLNFYAKAIQLAIEDRLQLSDKIRVLISGSNGWNLLNYIMTKFNDSDAVEVFIFEENPCSQLLINEAIEHLYADRITRVTVLNDLKLEEYYKTMDIVASITFESIYESQWLQFNFDRVCEYIRPGAIMIPYQSTLTIVPITSTSTYTFLQEGSMEIMQNGFENYSKRAQTMSPLYTRNLYECSNSQVLFSFKYRCFRTDKRSIRISSDTRMKRLEFMIERDCVVTGFGSYFQALLYKDITLNNQSWLNANNKNCVPMAYFPLKTPQTLNVQERLKAVFWLHNETDKQKYWYEWHTTAPIPTALHNLRGNAFTLQLPPQ
ncbi:protein arginine N-methyltransferase 5-like isoform X2 [Contarinia nasturtii]|uniref:protein arginine N-methyltransferase 5-like isoform X2 n=1 Tax=Contarinia nasturtii TaxID=265458 RepID=UPI0012D3FBED|nr:protein arginine N-methyltransferase 5-like isoform X2 [Contarinia nasturtii]